MTKTSQWDFARNSLHGAGTSDRRSRARSRRQRPCLEALEDRIALSLTPQLVADINLNDLSSNPSGLVAISSATYFAADDGVHGNELWKSDGTTAGTVLLKDINPGSASSNPFGPLTVFNGMLFFSADDGTHGTELWKSDGTAAGTVLVKDISAGTASSFPNGLTNVNGTLYFTAGSSLWKSDGTTAGTVQSPVTFNPSNLTNVNGTLFFTSYDYVHGSELWESDGTVAGTHIVKDIYAGQYSYYDYFGNKQYVPNSARPSGLTSFNGKLFFSAQDGSHERALWKSDGTEAGTVLLSPSAHNVTDLLKVNATLFFTADSGLWKSDGTSAGTVQVSALGYGATNLTNVNGSLFFTVGDRLWKSDGTTGGTVQLSAVGSNSHDLTNVNGMLFFTGYEDAHGNELWKSDGTAGGTGRVKDFYAPSGVSAGPGHLTNMNGTLVFTAIDAAHGVELWKSNGTAAGTVLLKDINLNTLGASPQNLTDVNGTLFFSADDGVHGVELWRSDGTIAGTSLVKDIHPGSTIYDDYYGNRSDLPNSSFPQRLMNVSGTLFFVAWADGSGYELWKSDGTAAGTVLVKDINPGGGDSSPNYLTVVNGKLYFTADDGVHGRELWKSDGTAAGTVLTRDIVAGSGGSDPRSLLSVNGILYFTADDGVHGRELWKSDGTAPGTVLVKDISPGSAGSYLTNMTILNGKLYFVATDGKLGSELWKSDGTASGTVIVKDIAQGAEGSFPSYLTNLNGTLFFAANDVVHGTELWKSDGTSAGTVLVREIAPGAGESLPRGLTIVNGTLYFSAFEGTTYESMTGWELWKSDGTSAGTVLVRDINPGTGSSSPWYLTNVNGTLFFTADDGTGNRKLWRSDGTASGTRLVSSSASNIANMTIANGTLFFTTTSGLWRSDGTDAGTFPVTNLAATSLTNVGGKLFFLADDGLHGNEVWTLVDGPNQGGSLNASGFPTTVSAGTTASFTVTAKNADGSTNAGYRGTVHFSSSDPQAVLPADYTFTATDGGVHTFSASLKTAGNQSITTRDTSNPSVAGAQSGITVNAATASHFTVTGFPSPVTAGFAGSMTVTAWDAYGNRATGYTGTVRFTSSDAQAALPGSYRFTATDAGAHTFSVVLKTAGTQSLTATDSASAGIAGVQYVVVNAAAARRLIISAPANVKAGSKFSLTITAVDAYGNVAIGYRGTIAFRSSDQSASLPRNYGFTALDQGVHIFTGLVLKKRGTQTITVTDTLDGSLTGSLSISVV